MFPSGNYFRDVSCPFFSRVSCSRPHCHFKHIQTSSNINTNTNTSITTTIPPDANATLNTLINQLSTAAAAVPTTSSTSSVDLSSIFQNNLIQSLTTVFANALNPPAVTSVTNNSNNAVPEQLTQALSTIATQLQQHQATLQQQVPVTTVNVNDAVPQYRPTPIAELERRKRLQQHHRPVKSLVKDEPIDFDSDEYVQATFSPPSPGKPESTEEQQQQQPKPSTVSKPNRPVIAPSNVVRESTRSIVEDNHSWVTPPPLRRKLSSTSNHNDFDERQPKLTPIPSTVLNEKVQRLVTQPPKKVSTNTKAMVPVTTTVNKNKLPTPLDPMLKRIPKKTTPTKVRVAEVDLNAVPSTSSISLERKKPVSSPVKRGSNGTSEVPAKKAKVTTTTIPKQTTITSSGVKRKIPLTNGCIKHDEDAELALFDVAFPSSSTSEMNSSTKKCPITAPPSSVQQLTARYSSLTSIHNDTNLSLSNNRTRAETCTDGRRIAHQPKFPTATPVNNTGLSPMFQPLVDVNTSSTKIPFKTRQEYLNFFLNELKRTTNPSISTTPIMARAQTIEKEIFDKSSNKNSYLNLAAKYLRQLRAEHTNSSSISRSNNGETATKPILHQQTSPKKGNVSRLVVSHSAMLTGGKIDNVSFGIKKQKQIDLNTITDGEFYTLLIGYKASERDLIANGYPAFSLDFPDKVLIKSKNPIYNPSIKVHSSDPNSRLCCRCCKTFVIDREGKQVRPEECIYHWGRIRSQRIARQIEKTYACCGSDVNAVGCVVGRCHVHEGDETQLQTGYVKIQPLQKQLPADGNYGIFAVDCEMCYTTAGFELVRVSVVNHKLQSIFETFVKPQNEILDYNTRWSGITETHLHNCHVTLKDVQQSLLKLFNEKSILIGHSLESDLKALKIVHETIIDTSLIFPHAKGWPYKRALKTLMADYLTKIIQGNSTDGHDSFEDAVACMELMLWKVKDDLKNSSFVH